MKRDPVERMWVFEGVGDVVSDDHMYVFALKMKVSETRRGKSSRVRLGCLPRATDARSRCKHEFYI